MFIRLSIVCMLLCHVLDVRLNKEFCFVLYSDQTKSVNLLCNTVLFLRELSFLSNIHVICVMRKPTFCICKNQDADQLRGNREADQRLCLRYTGSTIPLRSKSEISSL